jgi:membrane-associated phospholipid phosphatase
LEEKRQMWFDPTITDLLRNILPGLGIFFLWVSELGGEIFYIALLLIGYWAYNKKEAILATYILIVAVVTNYWLKVMIARERPPSSYWLTSEPPPNYSTPSGHAQNSATLYGWFAVRIKTWWMALIAVILTFLVGISRVYIGVHYIEDVLLGWGVGIITVLVLVYLEKPAREYISRYKTEHLLLVLAFIGFLMTLIAAILPQPPNDNFGAYGGLTMGFALALILEQRFVNFSTSPPDGKKWRLVARVVIGLVLVIGVMVGLDPLLPKEEIWLRAFRDSLIALTGVFVWPFIFKRVNL